MVCEILLLFLALVNVSVSVDTTYDPSGWNSYFTTEHSDNIDAVEVVDPSGWNYNRETKTSLSRKNEVMNSPSQQVSEFCQRVVEQGSAETNPVIDDHINSVIKIKIAGFFDKKEITENIAFVRRFIGILLNSAGLNTQNLEDGSNIDISGVVEIKVSPEHLKTLTAFINSDVNVSMRELDSILSASIHKKYIPTCVSESIDNIFFMIRQKEIWLPAVLFFIALFVLRLHQISKTKMGLVTSLIFLIVVLSYVLEYYRLYKDVEIRQKIILDKHSEIPSACDPTKDQWWSALFKSLGFMKDKKEECVEYHKAVLLDPLVEVSPSIVLSNILADFVLNPVSKVAKAIAAFSSAILGELPIFYGWIVWLSSSFAIFILIVIVLVILIGGRIQLFGLLSGVNISSQQAPRETLPPPEPAISTTPAIRTASQPLLEAVAGMSNFVLMDADSLGTLVLRAQTSVSTVVHSGVQELNIPPKEAFPSKPSNEKIDLNKLQQRETEKEDSDLKTVDEIFTERQGLESGTTSVVGKQREQTLLENSQVKELQGTTEVIQSDLTSSVLENIVMDSMTESNIEKHTTENVITDSKVD